MTRKQVKVMETNMKMWSSTHPIHSSPLMIADTYPHIAAFHHFVEEWHVTPPEREIMHYALCVSG